MMRLFLIVCIFLSACSAQKNMVETVEQSPVPSWVENRPKNTGVYIGVGTASKERNPDNYREIAKNNALNDMASEIKIIVEGSTILNVLEENENFNEAFESTIQTTTAEELEEYEIVGTWENSSTYWTYYRLSKQRYAAIKKQKKDAVLNAAFDLYQNGTQAAEKAELTKAVVYYLDGLIKMKPYWAETNYYIHNSDSIHLDNELYKAIKSTLTNVQIQCEPSVIRLNLENDFKQEVKIVAVFGQQKVENISLKLGYPKEWGVSYKTISTGEMGEVNYLVQNVNNKAEDIKLELLFQPENQGFEKGAVNDLTETLISGIASSTLLVPIQFEMPAVYIVSTEKEFGQIKNRKALGTAYQLHLTKNNFSITENRDEADLILEIESNTKRGAVSNDFHTTFLSASIFLKNAKTSEVVFSEVFENEKGVQLNFESASKDAYKRLVKKIQKIHANKMLQAVM